MSGKFLWILALAASSALGAPSYDRIGYIQETCPATFQTDAEFIPNRSFKVSPDEAVAAAAETGKIQCDSKGFKGVFRDNSKYYILIEGSLEEVAIDGRTKSVSSRTLAGVTYHQTFKKDYSQILDKQGSFSPTTPLLPTITSISPNRFATAVLDQTDPRKIPYGLALA